MSKVEIVAYRHSDQSMSKRERSLVEERPVKFIVNCTELLTLMASPHELRFLVAGFLYHQGFIAKLSDIQSLGACEESGLATIAIDGNIPERLVPTLTSGCGQGISYSPSVSILLLNRDWQEKSRIRATTIIDLMKELQNKAERYREHGGIHSAGLGKEGGLWIYAEDLGRHNTIDRLAGEALFRQIDTQRTVLVTSGRVSSELSIKGARLGVCVIATRTSPTDQAINICQDTGITLIGYCRGASFEVFTHPQRLISE